MIRPLLAAAAACALSASAAAGCGLGAGEDEGSTSLRVSRDAGAELLREATPEVRESDSVLDLLDREAEVTTRYGGGFVQSIEGLSGGTRDGRRVDWFFYVNGIESDVGSADLDARPGDAIWWDHRDWSAAMRVPAVVGSFPQPFRDGYRGERWTTSVRCAEPGSEECNRVSAALAEAGAATGDSASPGVLPGESDEDAIRVLVGPWGQLRADDLARRLESEPDRSGVFARFRRQGGRWALVPLDSTGQPVGGGPGGLIAALRQGDQPPTWVVTGTDAAATARAAEALSPDQLLDAFALVLPAGEEPASVPLPPGEGGS